MKAIQSGLWIGPATVLLQQQSRGEDGLARPSGVVWITAGTRLLRVAPEHLRFATARERVVEDMSRHTPDEHHTSEELVLRAQPGQFDDLLGQNSPPDDEDPLAPLGSTNPAFWQSTE